MSSRKYVVSLQANKPVFGSVWVDADSEDEAREVALDKASRGQVAWEDDWVIDAEVIAVEEKEMPQWNLER